MLFLGELLIFASLFAAASAPVAIAAWRKGHHTTLRKFTWGASGLAVVCAVISTTSQSLQARCMAAGNPTCNDYGSAGMVVLIVGVYVAVALIKTIQMVRP